MKTTRSSERVVVFALAPGDSMDASVAPAPLAHTDTPLRAVLRDRRWLHTCAVVGLIGLIPVVGWAAALGWMRAIATRGPTVPLPIIDRAHVATGMPMLAGLVAAAIPVAAVAAVVVLLGSALLGRASLALLVVTPFAVLVPALMLRVVVLNDVTAGLKIGALVDVVRRAPVEYVRLAISLVTSQLVLLTCGILLSLVGVLIAQPLTLALHALAYADFARRNRIS